VNDRASVFSVVLVRSCPLLDARSATRHEGRERSAVRKTVVMAPACHEPPRRRVPEAPSREAAAGRGTSRAVLAETVSGGTPRMERA
jgi:hypothetical protein